MHSHAQYNGCAWFTSDGVLGMSIVEKYEMENGTITIYKRYDTPNYYARIQYKQEEPIRISTNQTDLEKAVDDAKKILNKLEFSKEENIPFKSVKFRKIAEEVIELIKDNDEYYKDGKLTRTYQDRIYEINKYMIPILGNIDITKIDEVAILKFNKDRDKILGRKASKSTHAHHNATLKAIFEHALLKRLIKQSDIPKLSNKGNPSSRRTWFTQNEYRSLIAHSNQRIKTAKTQQERDVRFLLHEFIRFCYGTGLRPLMETDDLKWSDIKEFTASDGEKYLKLNIKPIKSEKHKGKPIARDSVREPLKKLKNRFDHLRNIDFPELSKVNEYVFILPNGKKPYSLTKVFDRLLKYANLKYDSDGNARSLYSLRHSYITMELLRGRDVFKLAKQVRTSMKMISDYYSDVVPEMYAEEFGYKFKPMPYCIVNDSGLIMITKRLLDLANINAVKGTQYEVSKGDNGQIVLSPI